jgi:HlyD family secretion protein
VSLFRAAALARLRSPDQLDQLVRTTPAQSWLALYVLIALTGAGILWGVFGSVRTNVHGQGILCRPGGVFKVPSEGSGVVMEVLVKPGDTVEMNQVIARIGQPLLEAEVHACAADLRRLRLEFGQTQELYEEGDTLYAAALERQRTDIDFSRSLLKKRLGDQEVTLKLSRKALGQHRQQLEQLLTALRERHTAEKEMLSRTMNLKNQRAVAETDLLQARRLVADLWDRIQTTRTELSRLDLNVTETEAQARKAEDGIEESHRTLSQQGAMLTKEELERSRQRKEALFEKQRQIHALESKCQLLEVRLGQQSFVRSPHAGRVIEVTANRGDIVTAAATLAAIEVPSEQLVVFVFVPADKGKKIAPGMGLEITPSVVEREEHGFIRGRVTAVSDFPATDEAMLRLIPNKNLIQEMSRGGVIIQMQGELECDSRCPSGFAWSTGSGYEGPIYSGTLCQCRVPVKEQAPIAKLIPFIKKLTGAD